MSSITKIYRLIIIALLLSSTVFSKGKISGEVKNSKGNDIVYVRVSLEPYDYGVNRIYETTTNVYGEFVIKKIKNGTYVLKVHHGDYAPYNKTVRIDGGLILNQDNKEINIVLKPKPVQKARGPSDESLIDSEILNTIMLTTLYLVVIGAVSVGVAAFFRYIKKSNPYNRLKERRKSSKSRPKKEKGLLSNAWLRIKNYFISLLIKYKNNAEKKRLKKAEKKGLRIERVKQKRLEKEEKKRLRLERVQEKRLERAEKKRLLLENVKQVWLERGERKRIVKAEQRLLKHEKYKIKMQLKAERMRFDHEKNKEKIQGEETFYAVKNPINSLDDTQPNEETLTFIHHLIIFTSFIYIYFSVWLDNNNFFVMYSPNILNGQIWRFVTPIFAHSNLSHITGNMFALYLTSKMCAVLYNRDQFIKSYLLLGIAGFIASFLFTIIYPRPSLGASGAIFGIFGMLNGHQRNAKTGSAITLYDLKPMWVYIGLMVVIGITSYGTDNAAHIGGFAAGYLYGYKIIGPNEV